MNSFPSDVYIIGHVSPMACGQPCSILPVGSANLAIINIRVRVWNLFVGKRVLMARLILVEALRTMAVHVKSV